ncbi:hypothetical protein AB0L63_30930 [Nocardia sp. NPDC051990]|uniref:hypothetical protein n=1 Tax=Nocardia sp. NPDC051990 TaxID=3155285 RepID=UPI00343A1074
MLRPGNSGANTATDHKTVLAQALGQLPWQPSWQAGRKVLVRTDAGGGTHEFVKYCHKRRVQYSLGSPSPTPSSKQSTRSPRKYGPPPTTPTDRSAKARGSLKSPTWSTFPGGRPG